MKSGKQNGFTLIELMITVVIIGILATIAMPAYQEYVKRGHRAAAQTEMMDIANRQQQFFVANRAYAATLGALNYTIPANVGTRYTEGLVVSNTATPPNYTITFTPKGAQAGDGALTLTSEGVKKRDGDASKW